MYAALIFFLSSIPQSEFPEDILFPDYVLHIVEYLPFGFLLVRAFKKTLKNLSFKKIIMYSCVTVFAYALSDELHQLFVPGRDVSIVDILSDNVGAFIGMRFAR